MATWREGGRECGKMGRKRAREKQVGKGVSKRVREREMEEGASSSFYSGLG